MKPFSEACEQNKQAILEIISPLFTDTTSVLEIGSGTGQHAVFFGEQMPHLTWQTSDVPEYHAGIRMWLAEAGLDNVLPPLNLDVDGSWPQQCCNAVFSANTAHIMSWPQVEKMFACVGQVLEAGGLFCLYGPFNYNGQFSSDSNARFDHWLKQRDPLSGVRDFEAVNELAVQHGMSLLEDYAMPANNRTLVWKK